MKLTVNFKMSSSLNLFCGSFFVGLELDPVHDRDGRVGNILSHKG